jgi:hypothetical protein
MAEHLTHGWEPDTPASDSLLRTFVEGTAARGEALAGVVAGRAARHDGIAMSDLGSPIFFDNWATQLAPCEYLDERAAMAALRDFYPADRGVLYFSAFPTWDLSGAGFTLMGHPPFMVRPAGGDPTPVPDDLEIRVVDSDAEAAVFAQTIEAAYPMPGAADSPVVKAWASEHLTLFNGYYGDRCVATGGSWNSDGVNDVNWISAMPETRRRGVGAAITYAATVVHPDDPAVLVASDDGVGVYERMGYMRLVRMTLWFREGQ